MSHSSLQPIPDDLRLSARLDRLPLTRNHVLWLIVLGIAMLIEVFDNTVFAYVAPSIRANWGMSIAEVGLITSAVFVGMLIGALVGGNLSDRFGRRPVLIWGSVFYSLMSLVCAFAPNFEVLAVGRVLTGVGVQAATGVLLVYAGEMFPRFARGRSLAVVTFLGFVGAPVTSLAALAIAPTGVEAWRIVFGIGAAGLVIAIVAAIWLPESVRWLLINGKNSEAERVVVGLERSAARSGKPLGPLEADVPAPPRGSLRDLLRPDILKRLIVTSVAFFLYIYCNYGFISWVPTILVDQGAAQADALRFATVLSFSTVAGPLLMFFVADKIERKTTMLLASLVGAGSLVVFAFASDPTTSLVAGFGAQLGFSVMGVVLYTYVPEVFPTNVRGAGFGVVSGFARIAGIIAGVSVAAIYTGFGYQILYSVLAIGLLAAGIVAGVFGPKTTNRSLEAISDASVLGEVSTERTPSVRVR
ncbi:MFS transporter [Microbacterium sp. Bi128]|uniref:MFS transporter n=1 Tax=Microbacterium sp. Bi128 TaxID=2821115 RepID=UPI001DAAF1F3|nr:MFS transporter [Microbacterium sp. Bi128]CAH0165917.1 Inner membrane metabolite transport protein YdjE [Microbacterium sp. Bi128]